MGVTITAETLGCSFLEVYVESEFDKKMYCCNGQNIWFKSKNKDV